MKKFISKEKVMYTMKNPFIYILLLSIIFQIFVYGFVNSINTFGDTPSYTTNYTTNIFKLEINNFRTPVYPLICQMIKFIGGEKNWFMNIALFQKIIFVLSSILFYMATQKIFKKNIYKYIAFFIYSFLPSLFLWSNCILTENVSLFETVFLIYLTICYLKKPNNTIPIFINILLLIMVMTRPAFLYLLMIYIMFWILQIICNKKNYKNYFSAFISMFIVIILIITYCSQVWRQTGIFNLSTVGELNKSIDFYKYQVYIYGPNNKIKEDIIESYDNNNGDAWVIYDDILSKHSKKEINNFIKDSNINAGTIIVQKKIMSFVDISEKVIGTNYTQTKQSNNVYKKTFDKLINILFPINFGTIYLLLLTGLIYLVFYYLKNKKLNWFLMFLLGLVGGNIFISVWMAPYETNRLCLISIPAIIILIFYLIDNKKGLNNEREI